MLRLVPPSHVKRRVGALVRQFTSRKEQASPRLLALVIDDPVSSWRAAGFAVDQGRVRLGDIVIVLRPEDADQSTPSRGLIGAAVGGVAGRSEKTFLRGIDLVDPVDLGVQVKEEEGVEVEEEAGDVDVHPNGVSELGELTLWCHSEDTAVMSPVEGAVKRLSAFGIDTHKGYPPREQGPFEVARYFFGPTRVLLMGHAKGRPPAPSSSSSSSSSSSGVAVPWMVGCDDERRRRGEVELTGWLPRVPGSEDALLSSKAGGFVGAKREAAQGGGRSILTIKRGAVPGLTGTFAFICNAGEGPLF